MIGLKLARPKWFDATALCIGSMMPDLMYSFSAYVHIDTHLLPAAFVYGIPLTVATALIVRFVIAPVGPAMLPDLGSFRLRSYAVLSRRRPAAITTLLCSTLGVGSHIVLDWFTHPGRVGPRWLGYDDVSISIGAETEPLATVFQFLMHTFGSLFAAWLLFVIGRRRLLDDWYGPATVRSARSWRPSPSDRWLFWSTALAGCTAGLLWGWQGERMERIERPVVGLLTGVALGSIAVRWAVRRVDRSATPPLPSGGEGAFADRIGC